MKMNPYVREWIDALRSGNYNQTTETLHDEGGFCAIGVACDLYDPNGWEPYVSDDDDDELVYRFVHDPSNSMDFMPPAVAERLGITRTTQSWLVKLNDGKKLTFEQIADYLEEIYS